ncbi:hypothetical protein [Flavobacterium flavipallidum]|uniref:LTXXQ motif family protein n=1 Tax=Flavobacterium flavipallidum TaxID=3139140 RepID=A0ABU9HQV8_9FLAO
MKKLFIVALLALGMSGFAQVQRTKANKKMEQMAKDLTLNDEQKTSILVLLKEQEVLVNDSKANPSNAKDNKKKRDELGKKINEILTPEQLELKRALQAAKKQ